MSKLLTEQELVDEYVDRWYLSEDGDSEALKESSKAEMKRQMLAIVQGAKLAHGEMVIGPNDGSAGDDEFVASWATRNTLRAEQRERNK